jgi:hypothetical protein
LTNGPSFVIKAHHVRKKWGRSSTRTAGKSKQALDGPTSRGGIAVTIQRIPRETKNDVNSGKITHTHHR